MASVKQDLLSGVFWSSVEKYSGLIVSIIVSMILARLLSPEQFGVVAIANVIILFLTMLCQMGIGPAIIQRRDLSNQDINSIYSITCILGAFLAIAFFFSSSLIASYYSNEALKSVCEILSINVFFSAANMVPNALMAKNKRFKQIAKRTLILQVSSGVLSVIAALLGCGIYSLLISPVLTSIGIFFYNRRFYKVNFVKKLSFEPFQRIFSYSAYQFLFQFINYWAGNIDKLIIGKYISSSDLGYYQKSYQLVQLPLNNVSTVINPVLQPVLSEFQDDKRSVGDKFLKIMKMIGTISSPVAALLFFCGTEIILVFYGQQWTSAIPSFKILSLMIPVQMILASSASFFQSTNETKKLFIVGFINSIVIITAILISASLYKTIEAIAWSVTITSYCSFAVTYYFILVIILKFKLKEILDFFTSPLIVGLISFVMLGIVDYIFASIPVIGCVVKILLTMAIIYLALLICHNINVFIILFKRLKKL